MRDFTPRRRRINKLSTFLLLSCASLLCVSQGTLAQDAPKPGALPDFRLESNQDYLPTDSKLNVVQFPTLDEMRGKFAAPGKEFASAPLWVWNDLLTEEQIRSTLDDLHAQHVDQAFVHPRPGLATPYLSEDWFALWRAALDEAKKNNMRVWIYDENSYPSGFAGGFVPDAMPESRGSGLDVVKLDSLVDANGAWQGGDAILYVVESLPDGTTKDRTDEILGAKNDGGAIPGKSVDGSYWVVGRESLAGSSQWFGGKTYVNLLKKGVLDAFVGFTHEAYRRELGDEFGKLIPGAFTDEPQIASAGMFSWVDDYREEFIKRRGYDIVPYLESLNAPVGNWKKIRYDYYKTTLELFIDRWHKPLGEYCEKVGLQYTGHDWEHGWPGAHSVPDSMATAFWRQQPAIDLLMNQFSRGSNSQFGNVRSVRELNSVRRQSGRSRAISENYGAGGYDIKFEDLKRLGDWSYALGVNMTDEHLSYISIRGARKHDHPQTFSYHSPWFEQYSKLEDYWTRLSYILSQGESTNERFLLLEPTSTAWLYQTNSGAENGKNGTLSNEFAGLLNNLEAAQIDYDLGSEDIIRRVGSVDGGLFRVGKAAYAQVVLPKCFENIDSKTAALLKDFVAQGGKLVALDDSLALVDGAAPLELDDEDAKNFEAIKNAAKLVAFDELVAQSRDVQNAVVVPTSNDENVFHMTRETSDALVLFLCNIDLKESASGRIELSGRWQGASAESFDALTGAITSYEGSEFELAPCNSLTLVFSKKAKDAQQARNAEQIVLDPEKLAGALKEVKPLDDNALVLDYMTVKLGDETIEDYFYRANGWFWKKKGFPMSPWDNGVQFKDSLISQRFADESGFELTYKFVKSDAVIDDLRFVVESPDMFEVYCNGNKVERTPGAWKFDRSFGVFDVAKYAKSGENQIKLVAAKSTLFVELMPAWIVGSFSLESQDQGFKIVADKGLKFNPQKPVEAAIPTASSSLEGVSWLTSGVNFSNADDRAPSVSFKFADAATIDAIRVWNYCEVNLAKRGVREFDLLVEQNGRVAQTIPCELKIGDTKAQTIELAEPLQLDKGAGLTFKIKSNWNGISYPVADDFVGTTQPENDNAFVGLAEVQFLTRDDSNALVQVASKVKVSSSSELVFRSHDRRAQYVADGSGLDISREGWASQGRPFYAGAVDYVFDVETSAVDQNRRAFFALPDRSSWDGAVVAILVDGKQIGAIGWQGEKVDLTDALKAAKAQGATSVELSVRVYGTPKNLFGPHHAGKLRGSAWPGSFHGAPQKQPSGASYDAIEYGLFTY